MIRSDKYEKLPEEFRGGAALMSGQTRWADVSFDDLPVEMREKLLAVPMEVLEDAVMTAFIVIAHRNGSTVSKEMATCYMSYIFASARIDELLAGVQQ